MQLTVLGATGGVGRHLVRLALEAGHRVTAVVRDPARLTTRHPELSVAGADALDPDALEPLIAGADAVLSGIGAAGRHDPLRPASTSAGALVAAAERTGTRRVLVVSAAPLNRSGEGQSRTAHRVFAPLLWAVLREQYSDLERMERILRESTLEWTCVRPPRLTDAPGRGRYRHTVEAGPPGDSVPRADVARAMLDFVSAPATVRRAVGVSR